MSLLHSEYKDRLAHWQRVLAEDFYHPLGEIVFEGFATMEHLTPEEALRGNFRPMPEGTVWGHTWEYLWVRASVVLPEQAAGKPVVLSLDIGGEATLFVNGQAFGTRRADWVSVPHHYLCDNVLTQCAAPGEQFDLLFEVYAGHYFPDVGGCCTGPVLPGTMGDPKAEGSRTRMGRSTFGIWNEDAYQLWMDVSTLTMLMNELPEDSLRAAKIADGLEAYTRIVDFEQPEAERRERYRKARAALQKDAAALHTAARQALLAPQENAVTVFNGLGFAREEIVELPAAFAGGATTAGGDAVPVCAGLARVTLPSFGAVTLLPAANPENTAARPQVTAVATAQGAVLRSDRVTLTLDREGHVTSYTLDGREMTAGRPMNLLRMYKDVPRIFDAWDIDSNYRAQESFTSTADSFTVVKAAGFAASVRWTGRIGHSRIEQTITLRAGSPVAEFDTTVDWQELHRLLKVEFPVDVRAENAIHEIQFGYVERPTHRSRGYDQQRFEVCNHRYTALCDNAHGCAVLNDCKYGVGVEQNSIELTLLRAAASPEMASDQGEQTFRYGFTAWNGSFADAPVVRQAAAFNDAPLVERGALQSFSAFSTDAENVLIDTLKPAEDGSNDMVLRLYESKKADTFYHIRSGLPVQALIPCDLLEEPVGAALPPDAVLHVRPFEVTTYRVRF